MSSRGFLIEILLHKYNAQQTEAIFFKQFFIHFYYSQILRTFSRSFYYFLFKLFFNDCDVTASSRIIHSIAFRNYEKHPIKVLQNNIL